MKLPDLKSRKTWIIASLVVLFTLFTVWLRILPLFVFGNGDNLSMVASDDPLYNLRQVEFLVANHLNYSWFDPMTLYPQGSLIYWGPLFTTIIASACLLVGATTRPEIISVGLLIPPLMAAATTIVMYYVGKTCGDWKTGLLASAFTAVVTGQYFFRSMYGYMDHHIAEVLFSTIFCLMYMYAISSKKDKKIDLKNINTYKDTILVGVLAGIAYLLGFFVMPTMILFAMMVGLFTVVQFIIDSWRGKSSEYLLIINAVIFIVAIIGLLIFGFKTTTIDLSMYSVGHVYAYLGLIGGTGFLYFLQQHLKTKEKYYYPAILVGVTIAFVAVLYVATPSIYGLFVSGLFNFFGQEVVTNTVQEARGWTTDMAWATFNYGLYLMIGGMLLMLYNNIKEEHPEQIFAVIWSLIVIYSTWQHVRYEYYMAINVALLSALCLNFGIVKALPYLNKYLFKPKESEEVEETPVIERRKKHRKGGSGKSSASDKHPLVTIVPVIASIVIILLSLAFAYISASYSYGSSMTVPTRMNGDWKESMEWLQNNTPDTGIGYLTEYNKNNFTYPNTSYGVMSWWDYGHLITTVGKRIPNANPFQQGVDGPNGSASYFMSTDEDTANNILNIDETRYVVTDIEMSQGKFWAMATWYNRTVSSAPFYEQMFVPTNTPNPNDPTQTTYTTQMFYEQPYYMTMIARLHNLDGTMTEPSEVDYVAYADPSVTKNELPVIVAGQATNASIAAQKVAQYNSQAQPGYEAGMFSINPISPIEEVPALQHYRLVHESPTNVLNSAIYDVKYVKTFEYVKGAHIKGEGIINVSITTDTGRNFTYRQASVNGEFIVPYSTEGSTYGVKTNGKYIIENTTQEYDVSEEAVMNGLTVG